MTAEMAEAIIYGAIGALTLLVSSTLFYLIRKVKWSAVCRHVFKFGALYLLVLLMYAGGLWAAPICIVLEELKMAREMWWVGPVAAHVIMGFMIWVFYGMCKLA